MIKESFDTNALIKKIVNEYLIKIIRLNIKMQKIWSQSQLKKDKVFECFFPGHFFTLRSNLKRRRN